MTLPPVSLHCQSTFCSYGCCVVHVPHVGSIIVFIILCLASLTQLSRIIHSITCFRISPSALVLGIELTPYNMYPTTELHCPKPLHFSFVSETGFFLSCPCWPCPVSISGVVRWYVPPMARGVLKLNHGPLEGQMALCLSSHLLAGRNCVVSLFVCLESYLTLPLHHWAMFSKGTWRSCPSHSLKRWEKEAFNCSIHNQSF